MGVTCETLDDFESLRGDPNDLKYGVAHDRSEVSRSWNLVYRSYPNAGLIGPNPYRILTHRQAVSPLTAVGIEFCGRLVSGTVSGILDGPGGLPMDSSYRDELDYFRNKDLKIAEVALLASCANPLNSLACFSSPECTNSRRNLSLLRIPFSYAVRNGSDMLVCGVHPAHAPYYERIFGFERRGEEKVYPAVRNNPVVLLALNLRENPSSPDSKFRGLRFFADNPLPSGFFDNRYPFDSSEVDNSPFGKFLDYKAVSSS